MNTTGLFVKAVQHTGADVVSVAFDELDAEQTYINDVMLPFLCGNGNIVPMVDPNHVAKCVRSRLVLGSRTVIVSESFFDVGLLQ
eukprot:7962530-Ditylum_brightwellii.AAC.1